MTDNWPCHVLPFGGLLLFMFIFILLFEFLEIKMFLMFVALLPFCLKGDKEKIQKMVQMAWTFINDRFTFYFINKAEFWCNGVLVHFHIWIFKRVNWASLKIFCVQNSDFYPAVALNYFGICCSVCHLCSVCVRRCVFNGSQRSLQWHWCTWQVDWTSLKSPTGRGSPLDSGASGTNSSLRTWLWNCSRVRFCSCTPFKQLFILQIMTF